MNNAAVLTLLGFYLGTVFINIIIAVLQWHSQKNRINLTILVYWLGIALTAFLNSLFQELDFKMVLAAGFGTFISQFFLGSFFAQIRQVQVSFLYFFKFYLVAAVISWAFFQYKLPFAVCSMPLLLAEVYPALWCYYKGVKNLDKPLSLIQKIFVITAIAMSLHYLDWAFTRPNPEFFILGLAIAFAILHIISVLVPMMSNDHTLQIRNEKLEDEVRSRAEQLTNAQQQLWEANKFASLGRMAGSLAHELNNPLSIISLSAQNIQNTIKQQNIDSAKLLEQAKNIENVVDRISQITTSLRQFARDARVEMNQFEINNIIKDTLSFCTDSFKKAEIQFTYNPSAQAIFILCNPIEISRVLINLLNNAVDALENTQNKQIELTVKNDNHKLLIEICDSGHIDPSIINQIMDPFFTTKPFGKGSGLGLSISRSIIENHKGRLFVDTQSMHTKFVIELPVAQTQSQGTNL